MVVTVLALCVINLFLWFIFFKRFTKLFTINDVIQNSRSEMNKLIMDMNRNTERDITLIDDKIKQLKDLIAEADKHINLASSELQKQKEQYLYGQTVENVINTNKQPFDVTATRAARAYERASIADGGRADELKQRAIVPNNAVPAPVLSNNPVKVKKSFALQVQELYERNKTVEEIAVMLDSSTTEVEFALDMSEP